jgi:hypothetical protein
MSTRRSRWREPGVSTWRSLPAAEARAAVSRHPLLVAAALAGTVALVAYLTRLLPGVGFWDTGIFQAAAATLGLTHPTGYPTYMLLGWAWISATPWWSPATAMNILSALSAAVAVAGIVVVARRIGAGLVVSVAMALVFALSLAVWRTAERADPHTLHAAFVAVLLALALEWRERGHPQRWLLMLALVYGLALGNHLLTATLAPALGLFVVTSDPSLLRAPGTILRAAGAMLAGLAVYLYVPLRGAMDPLIHHDWAPTTPDLFLRYVLGLDFQSSMGFLSSEGPGRAIGAMPQFLAQLGDELGPATLWIVLGLAALGFTALIRRSPAAALLLGLSALGPLYAALTYENADIERYYFATIEVLVIVAALGASLLLAPLAATQVPALRFAPAMLLLLPVSLLPLNAERVRPVSAECFVDGVLSTAPPRTIVMSWWSYSTPLWYGQYVEHRRPDVEVVNGLEAIPAELERRADEGRPIYLIEPDWILASIGERHRLEPVDVGCGMTIQAVAGLAG